MSSCLVLQQKNSLFIASDTAVSSIFNGKRIRVSNKGEKLFKKDNALIFCSGKMTIATDCKKYIEGMENLSIDAIQEFVSCLSIDGLFEVFIGIIENGTVKTYQLSSYNDFKPVERALLSGQTEIFALGFNTENMLNDFESYLGKTDVIDSIKNTFNNNICTEVGGNLDIMYYYNGLTYQSSHSLKDSTLCLVDILNEENHHLVIADTLIGRMILGQELYISNADVSVAIRDNGLTIRDKVGRDKVFLGLDKDQSPEFRLGTKEDKSHLLWSKEGLDIKADKIMIGSEGVVTDSKLEQTSDSILIEVSNVEDRIGSKIEATANTIRLEVSGEVDKLNSSITLTNDKIESKVDKDGVISSINQTAEAVKIQASKIELTGYVTVNSLAGNGTTTINGSNIKTGVLSSQNGNLRFNLDNGRLHLYDNKRLLSTIFNMRNNRINANGMGILTHTDSFIALGIDGNDDNTLYSPYMVLVGKEWGNIYKQGVNFLTRVNFDHNSVINPQISFDGFKRNSGDYVALYGSGASSNESKLILEMGNDYTTSFEITHKMYNNSGAIRVANFRAVGGSESNQGSKTGINFYQNLGMHGCSIWGANTLSATVLVSEEAEVASLTFNTRASAFLRQDDVKYTAAVCMRPNMEHFGSSKTSEGFATVELPLGFMHSGYIVMITPHSSGSYHIEKFDEYFNVYGDIEGFDYIIKGEME